MAAYNKFNPFVENIDEKVHNLQSDQLKVALTNSAPAGTAGLLSDISEISYTNLSTRNITTSSSSQTGGTYSYVPVDLVLTASGGAVGPFRYPVIYNSSAAGSALICYFDYGSSITLADGETFTLDFGSSLFTLS